MNKRIKMLTDIAVAAAVTLLLAVALLPAGAEELVSEITEENQSISSTPVEEKDELTSGSTLETTTESEKPTQPPETTTTEAAEAETTTEEPDVPTEAQTATDPPPTTTPPPQSTAQTTESPGPGWTEQETSAVMYVNTDGIYSREVAQVGSVAVKQYELNEAVTVVAITDTDYYKLEDGTFIHVDYLSDTETATTTAEQTEPPVPEAEASASETEASEPDTEAEDTVEIVDDVVPLSARVGVQSTEMEMYDMVNEYRAQYGLSPLEWDYNAYPAAQIRAGELLQYNSHTRPDGTSYSSVYNQLGYSPSATGENIVYYYSAPRSALDVLINSPEHRELILSTKFSHISIACVYDENSYWGYYWVQEFTTP